jgi:DNA-directed RNA polymerase subunit RPC12/RpoP
LSERKVPYELICFKCLKRLEWTGFDSGDYLVFKCPGCGFLIGVKKECAR